MKIMLDSCVWGKARQPLEAAGHDVIWSGDWPSDPGDEEILAHAHREGRILVTLDKDFGELAVVYGQPHAGIFAWSTCLPVNKGRSVCVFLNPTAMSYRPEPSSPPTASDSASARPTNRAVCKNNPSRKRNHPPCEPYPNSLRHAWM